MSPGACYPRPRVQVRRTNIESRRNQMNLCPIALVAGCKKCPLFTVCPLKSVIGDYKREEGTNTGPSAEESKP